MKICFYKKGLKDHKQINLNLSNDNSTSINFSKYVNSNYTREVNNCEFELFSIVLHYGQTLNGGHFTSLCKNMNDRKWRHFNDSHVSMPINSLKDFLNERDDTPYILFFYKKEQTSNF